MSRHHNNDHLSMRQGTDMTSFNAVVDVFRRDADRMNHLVERTGECLLLLSGYMAYRVEIMKDGIDGNSPFVMKLRNKTAGILRACDDFLQVIEPLIKPGDDAKEAYIYFNEVITQSLDSLFDDIHRDFDEPQLSITRRAKLRYHDPYPTAIKECTAAFEDGYCKGYTDAMDDFVREVANLADDTDTMLSVTIGDDGKINIRKP